MLRSVSVVGDLAYGATSGAVTYAPPGYQAFRFVAAAGDHVRVVVHDDVGDIQAILTDSGFNELLSLRSDGEDLTLDLVVGAGGDHYVAFRELARGAGHFTVSLLGEPRGCVPATCAVVGARCGELDDGCGGIITCGCSLPSICGGGGLPGICASPEPGDPFDGLADDALRHAIHQSLDGHLALGYDRARQAMFSRTAGIDVLDGLVTCLYTGRQVAPDDSPTPPGMSIEHSWPQSLGASAEPMRSDLHHLFAADVHANSARNNYPYGVTDCGAPGRPACLWTAASAALGASPGMASLVFQPRPEGRGDVARATFYFAARYDLQIPDDEETLLRGWNEADPPDDAERLRNDRIAALQHNRNVFVDRPDLVRRVANF